MPLNATWMAALASGFVTITLGVGTHPATAMTAEEDLWARKGWAGRSR